MLGHDRCVHCTIQTAGKRMWVGSCGRRHMHIGLFRGKGVVVLGSTYGQPLRVPGEPGVGRLSANQGQTLVLR